MLWQKTIADVENTPNQTEAVDSGQTQQQHCVPTKDPQVDQEDSLEEEKELPKNKDRRHSGLVNSGKFAPLQPIVEEELTIQHNRGSSSLIEQHGTGLYENIAPATPGFDNETKQKVVKQSKSRSDE